MVGLDPVSAARLASLASGRGGVPSAEEWPFVACFLLIFALVGTRMLLSVGLTRVESMLVAGFSPLLVVVDAPLGMLSGTVSLAANLTGCLIPVAIGLKVLFERRVPYAEGILLVAVSMLVSYMSSRVEPDRGVLLQYRIPATVIGILAAGFFYASPERAGAAGFAAGGIGVLLGADVLNLRLLAEGGGAGRVILGGAGLLDGILLVALLGAAIAACTSAMLRAILKVGSKTRAPV